MKYTLDIGGTFTKFGWIENGVLIHKGTWRTVYDGTALLRNISESMPLMEERIRHGDITTIAISSGGFWLDGRAIAYETIQDTADGQFIASLEYEYKCPVLISNDAICAMLAERESGVLVGVDNAVIFLLGSSLGCAALVNGRLMLGHTGQGASMFAMPESLIGDDYISDCHANSKVQIKRMQLAGYADVMGMNAIEALAVDGDKMAATIISDYAKAVALKCWYAYLMYDPECIVFGGGISHSEMIMSLIKNHAAEYFQRDASRRVLNVVIAKYGENSNLIGAGLLDKQ